MAFPGVSPACFVPRHKKRLHDWKSTAIRHKDGNLILSNGRGREPIVLETDIKPRYVEMYYDRGAYYFALVSKVAVPPIGVGGCQTFIEIDIAKPNKQTLHA